MALYTKSVTVGRFIGKLRNKPKQLRAVLAKFKKQTVQPVLLNKRHLTKMPDSHADILAKSKANPSNRNLLHSGVQHRLRQYHEGQIANDDMIFKHRANLPPVLVNHLNSMTDAQRAKWRMQGLSLYNARHKRLRSIKWQRAIYGPKSTREHYKKIAKAFLKNT